MEAAMVAEPTGMVREKLAGWEWEVVDARGETFAKGWLRTREGALARMEEALERAGRLA